MQVIYIHMMISLVGGFCVLSYGQGSGLRNILKINHDLSDRGVYRVLSRSIWKRHGINRNDRANGQATGMSSTGVSSRKADDTSVHNLNSAGLMLKRITTAKRERPEHRSLSVSTESETVNSGGCCRRRIEKLNSERPAVMETPGGDDTFPKPPSISKPRVGMRNRRRRRAAAEDTLKRREENKQLKNTSLGSTQTMWEPMPRPLALNLSTDIPFDMTTNLETFPDDELFVATTLVPLLTRGKANRLKNPFYPLSSESYGAYTILCISVIIFLVGILGNIAITCIVCQNFYMRSISNSLLANLALWDFVILFFCMPLIIFHELTKTWLLGEFSCKIIPYIEVASLGVTTFTLCALCIDRYRAATNVQMYYEMMENCSSTAAKLAVIWVGALLLALPELLLRQLEMDESQPTGSPSGERCAVRVSTELPDPIYVLGLTYQGARLWWYFGCYFCLPTLFTIISSLATARKIQRAERACVRGTKKQIRLESQMNCTVVALAILYGLCIVPENICNIVSAYMAAGVPRHTLDVLQLLGQLLLFCKSAAAPVLLLCLCRPFGRAFLDCCCCCCAECGSSAGGAATADDDRECTAELELSPFNTVRRETSPYAPVGTRC